MLVSEGAWSGNNVPLLALLTLNGVQRSFATDAVKLENIGYVVVINVTNPSTLEGDSQVATLDTVDLDGNGTPDGTDIKAGRSPLLPQAKLAALGKTVALIATVRKEVVYCTFSNVSAALQRRFHPKFRSKAAGLPFLGVVLPNPLLCASWRTRNS